MQDVFGALGLKDGNGTLTLLLPHHLEITYICDKCLSLKTDVIEGAVVGTNMYT